MVEQWIQFGKLANSCAHAEHPVADSRTGEECRESGTNSSTIANSRGYDSVLDQDFVCRYGGSTHLADFFVHLPVLAG